MTKTAPKLSTAQLKTLRTIIAAGGEMNGYAGQPGFYGNSVRPLADRGLLERIPACAPCAANDDWENEVCERPLAGQKGGQRSYARVRVTPTGREAVAAATN